MCVSMLKSSWERAIRQQAIGFRQWYWVPLSHVYQTRLGALRPSHLLWCAVVHLAHRGVGWVAIRVGVDVAAAVVRWRVGLRGLPANLAHVRAATCASSSCRVLLQVGLQRGRRTVAGRVRGWPNAGVVAGGRRRRSRTAHTEVGRQRAALCHVLELGMSVEAVGSREVQGRRHHGVVAG